jgi:RNA polymerase sigma-70 factor, ECF subfamily
MATGETIPSDELLMARYAQGDGKAFEELFARYEGRAYRFFLSRTCSEQQARDLYQDLFVRIHRARGRYDPARPFAPWFFQIARRLWIDEMRRASLRSSEVALAEELVAADVGRTERRLMAEEGARAALERLSEVERYVLVSAKVEGRSYLELARELDRSVVAVKKLASRAMQRLRASEPVGVRAVLPV